MAEQPGLSELEPILDEAAQFSPLSQQAYERIRESIVTLRLAPGALINEATLIDELGLGRTPIREALQRLASEGLIVMRPRRGASVASLNITDLQQIFELRRTLEGYAAGLAAERATPTDLERMHTVLAALEQIGPDADAEAHIAIDRAFHRALARAAHNPFLEATLARMYTLSLRLWYLALARIGPMRESIEDLRAVVDAVARRDSAQAEAALRAHITAFQQRIRDIL